MPDQPEPHVHKWPLGFVVFCIVLTYLLGAGFIIAARSVK